MTEISQTKTHPTSTQSQHPAAPSLRDISQQPESFGTTGDGDADDGQLSTVAERTRAKLAQNLEPAKRTAKTLAENQKAAGADKMGDIARVIHGAAGQLESELPRVAKSVHDAARTMEEAATALRERSVDDVIDSCVKFARTQPAAFFAAAALTGFALARLLKSSTERARSNQEG